MDLKEIKQIVDLMKKSDLTEFEIEQEGLKLKIKRSGDAVPHVYANGGTHAPFTASETGSAGLGSVPPLPGGTVVAAPVASNAEEPGTAFIKSPMVGTFYRAPSPDSQPFVDVGAKVQENSVVCILEAMKIMNEIQAEVRGTILEALVENGQPVEFGQRLFKVKVA